MSRRVLVQVGTHKTGTTSLQTFLREHDGDLLAAAGWHYPPGFLLPGVHTDLPLLTIRAGRSWPARLRFPETTRRSWREAARAHVRAQIGDARHHQLVYVHEDLSYLRGDDELAALAGLLEGRDVTVAVVLRHPAEFLRSYRAQLEGTGFALDDDPASFAYTEPDSWLVDHVALVDGFRRQFGASNVIVFDYGELMRRDRGVIPAFTDLLGIERRALPALEAYQLNKTGSPVRLSEDRLTDIRRDLAERFP